MKKIRILLLTFIILLNSIFASGCWNYREIDDLSIIAGLAIDKGIKNQFQMTAEIIKVSGGKESKTTSRIITTEGKTMFDAARNMIALNGRRLYWAHAQVIILSEKVASEGVTKAIEWYIRDSETREGAHLLISKRPSAKDIFNEEPVTEEIKSFEMEKMIKNQVGISKAPRIDIMKYSIESKTKGISTVIPVVDLVETSGKVTAQVTGTAIIKNDKLAGFLNPEETKDLIFIRNEIKGGLLIEETQGKDVPSGISLEIFKSKTKVTPVIEGKDVKINIKINTTVAIDEIDGKGNFFDEAGLKQLEQTSSNMLKNRVETLIKKVQSDYDADIFGFASKLQENKVKAWKSIGGNWDETFANLRVDVNTKVHIKNSAILSKSIEEGD